MKKVFDELYGFKRTLQDEIEKLNATPRHTTNDHDGGKAIGKIEGRLEAKQSAMIQLDQIISNILK